MALSFHYALNALSHVIGARVRSERAASLVEYALLVALIAVVCIAAVTALGKKASSSFSSVSSRL